jgi:hypothetical protein
MMVGELEVEGGGKVAGSQSFATARNLQAPSARQKSLARPFLPAMLCDMKAPTPRRSITGWASPPLSGKFTIWALLIITVYGFGYGVARWRKFIVMHEYDVKEQRLVVRQTGPGWDVRDDWRGHLKNCANPLVFFCFRPLCWIEDCVRGSTKALSR